MNKLITFIIGLVVIVGLIMFLVSRDLKLGGSITPGNTTTTSLTITSLTNTALATDANGNVIATTSGGVITETDPIWSASSWFGTTNNSSNWNTAFSWGNHALAGYLTSIAGLNISLLNNDAGYVTTSGSGTPGGSDTQIQFNNAGSFGASTSLTFVSSTGVLNSSIVSSTKFIVATSTSVNPGYTFSGNTNTGFFQGSTINSISISTGGNTMASFSSAGINIEQSYPGAVFRSNDGTALLPSYIFSGDTNTGFYHPVNDSVGITVGGKLRVEVSTTPDVLVAYGSINAKQGLTVTGTSTNNIAAFYTSSSAVSMCAVAGGAVGYGTCAPAGMVEYTKPTQMDVFWTATGANTSTVRLVNTGGANYFQSATNTAISGSGADLSFTSMFAGATWFKLRGTDGAAFFPTAYGDDVGAGASTVYMKADGQIGTIASSRKYKKNIVDVSQTDTNFISNLQVKKYDYKDEKSGTNEIGLVAEDVAAICPKCVSYERKETKVLKPSPSDPDKMIEVTEYTTTSDPLTVNYASPYMIASMIAKIQELENRISVLEGQPMGSSQSLWDKFINWITNLL